MKILLSTFFVFLFSLSTFAATYAVTRSDDRNTACLSGVDCSLREAVNVANSDPSDDFINFAPAITTITLAKEIRINNAGTLIINGNGANVFTIDGGPGTNRIFYINQAVVSISGATLTGGNGGGDISQDFGGAIFTRLGSLTLDGVHVKANSVENYTGGGVYFDQGINHQILNSTFSANNAYYCGGFVNSGGSVTVSNSTISDNKSIGVGGGFCTTGNSGKTTLQNVTVTANIAGGGGFSISSYGTVIIGNSIVAGNTSDDEKDITFLSGGKLITQGNNILGYISSTTSDFPTGLPNVNHDFVGSYYARINPLLAPLNMNGGTTPTHALLEGSPAINKGNNQGAPATDQRGFARIVGGTIDIGAYELAAVKTRKRVRVF